jgi:hypothetical protein
MTTISTFLFLVCSLAISYEPPSNGSFVISLPLGTFSLGIWGTEKKKVTTSFLG